MSFLGKHVLSIVKILLAVGLVAFVLTKVDFADRLIVHEKKADAWVFSHEHTGRIEGDWKTKTVSFTSDDGKVFVVEPGERDGRKHELRPGITTVCKNMQVPIFLLGALCFFVVAAFSAARWCWLLHCNDLAVSFLQAFRLTWIGVFFNNVVPGLTGGDVVKAIYVARITGKKTRPILSVLVDRVLGLIALAILAAIAVSFNFANFRTLGWTIYVGLGLLLGGTICFFSRRVRRKLRLDTLLSKLPAAAMLKQIEQAIYFYKSHMKGLCLWLFLSILNHIVGVIGVYLIGEALGLDLSLGAYLVLIPVINIASAVPIAPAGWGVGEYLYQKLFTDYCLGLQIVHPQTTLMPTLALVLSIIYRLHIMLWSLLGAVFLIFEKSRPTTARVSEGERESAREREETIGEPVV